MRAVNGTILGDFRQSAREISEIMNWQEALAVEYILLGTIPSHPKYSVSFHLRSPIEGDTQATLSWRLDVYAPISSKEIAAINERVNQQVWGSQRPRDSITQKDIDLVIFVDEWKAQNGRPRWRKIASEWNASHPPDWEIDSLLSQNMSKAYNDAKKKIIPKIHFENLI